MSSKPQLSDRARVRFAVCSLEARLAPAILPIGYTEVTVANDITRPTSMEFAPDGKLYISEKAGSLEVWQNGARLTADFFNGIAISVDAQGERGLGCVVLDPNFRDNRYIYVYYTTPSPVVHNRLSRFTANATGTQWVPNSELVLLDLPSPATFLHQGGALHFGPDGKLYVAVGDNFNGSNSQSLENPFGKILRINSDGTIPDDNPFYDQTTGDNRAIWALGLRNPFTFAFQPGTGRMHINDVGDANWEEVNLGAAGANYGWPLTEGDFNQADFPSFTRPLHTYNHLKTGVCITGGVFYNPESPQFPQDWVGDYFFADFGIGWIDRLDMQSSPPPSVDFATGVYSAVDLEIDAEGALYYLVYPFGGNGGGVARITVDPAFRPQITEQPADLTVSVGMPATFSVTVAGPGPFAYRWQRDGSDITGATASSYTIPATTPTDHGAVFRVIVSNTYGQIASNGVTLNVDAPSVSSVLVNSGAAQRSRLTTLTVEFNSNVSFSGPVASAFTLTRSGGGAVDFTARVSVVDGVTLVTLTDFMGSETSFGSLRDGRYTLTTLAAQISAGGLQMAGDFTFGDAQGLYRYYGDMNGDRRVDISDFGFFSLAYFNPPNYNAALDFNNDGRIDVTDFGQFSVRFFTTLP